VCRVASRASGSGRRFAEWRAIALPPGAYAERYGGLFYTFAVFPHTAVTVTGETSHYRFRHFCPVCGSSVFDKRGSEVEVSAGTLDAENLVRPTYETWVCRRERWLPDFPVDHRYEHDRE
jgi:hypothetical protein